ncbi:MAG: ASPIC/UnbV domain-containing protein, partial [Pseudooceanicola atlanticus]
WLLVDVAQPAPNPDAVGAFIELETGGAIQTREVTVGGGHAGGQAGWQHFGLGAAEAGRLRVIWPDGTASDWRDVVADDRVVVTR